MSKIKFQVVQDWALQTTRLLDPETGEIFGPCTLITKWESVMDYGYSYDKARYTVTDVELEANEAVLSTYPWGSTGVRSFREPLHRDEVSMQVDGKMEEQPFHRDDEGRNRSGNG